MKDCDAVVRSGVAGNHRSSQHMLEILSTGLDWNVRSMVAGNPNASDETLTILKRDANSNVRIAARRALHARAIVSDE